MVDSIEVVQALKNRGWKETCESHVCRLTFNNTNLSHEVPRDYSGAPSRKVLGEFQCDRISWKARCPSHNMIHFSTTLLYMCVELTCFSTRGIYVYVKEGYGKKGTMFSTLVEKIAKKNRSRLSIAVFWPTWSALVKQLKKLFFLFTKSNFRNLGEGVGGGGILHTARKVLKTPFQWCVTCP